MTNTISRERTSAIESTTTELGKISVKAIAFTSAMLGCWAVACLVGGMISSGGPVSLVMNFVSSFIG